LVRIEINNFIAKLKSMFLICWKKSETCDFQNFESCGFKLWTYKFCTCGIMVANFKNLEFP